MLSLWEFIQKHRTDPIKDGVIDLHEFITATKFNNFVKSQAEIRIFTWLPLYVTTNEVEYANDNTQDFFL